MQLKDIVFVEGSFRDTLFANDVLEDFDRCVKICVLLGVKISDAEEFTQLRLLLQTDFRIFP